LTFVSQLLPLRPHSLIGSLVLLDFESLFGWKILEVTSLAVSGHGIVWGGGVALTSRVDEVKGITSQDTCWWQNNDRNEDSPVGVSSVYLCWQLCISK